MSLGAGRSGGLVVPGVFSADPDVMQAPVVAKRDLAGAATPPPRYRATSLATHPFRDALLAGHVSLGTTLEHDRRMINRFFDTSPADHHRVSYDATEGFRCPGSAHPSRTNQLGRVRLHRRRLDADSRAVTVSPGSSDRRAGTSPRRGGAGRNVRRLPVLGARSCDGVRGGASPSQRRARTER